MGTAPVGSMSHYPVGWPCRAHPTADLVRLCPRAVAARSARRAPPCRSHHAACASDCGRVAQPWARMAHIRMVDALVPGIRHAWRVARARAPWRTHTTPHSRGPFMCLGGADAQRGGPLRHHRTYRSHVQCNPACGTCVRGAAQRGAVRPASEPAATPPLSHPLPKHPLSPRAPCRHTMVARGTRCATPRRSRRMARASGW